MCLVGHGGAASFVLCGAPYAPSRTRGYPPDAYIEVAQLDILRNEAIAHAQRLADAGVPAELHVHPGCPARLRLNRTQRGRITGLCSHAGVSAATENCPVTAI